MRGNPSKLQPPKKGDPPRNPKGRPKGSKNRSTLLGKWLNVKVKVKHPAPGKGEVPGIVEDEVILALIQKASLGDVAAIKEVLDSRYGKIPNAGDERTENKLQTAKLFAVFLKALQNPTRSPIEQLAEAIERYCQIKDLDPREMAALVQREIAEMDGGSILELEGMVEGEEEEDD